MHSILDLTAENFSAFGSVARAGDDLVKTIRNGAVILTRSAAVFEHDEHAVDHALEFYQVKAEGSVLEATQAEQHPHSAQMFIPMNVEKYLVVVWEDHPNNGGTAHAFVGSPEDVVIYKPGVWHHGIVALGRDGLFASTMWKTRGGTDVEFLPLSQSVTFDLTKLKAAR